MGIWLLGLLSVALACPGLRPSVNEVQRAVLEGRLDDADAAFVRAEQSLACDARAPAPLIARFWLAEGVIFHLRGDEQNANDAFAAARATDPDTWVRDYGPTLKKVWASATSEPGQFEVRLDVQRPAEQVRIDGRPTTLPATLPAGLHSMQVLGSSGEARYGQFFYGSPGSAVVFDTDLPPTLWTSSRRPRLPGAPTRVANVERPTPLPPEPPPERARRWPWVVGGTVVAVVGTTAVIWAARRGEP